ncbi:hypothetical protein ASE66_23615 [Bosea sp. Root483D1]|nr:hypothetical protein ASE66_23615 [Bosea sp. Root483D1]
MEVQLTDQTDPDSPLERYLRLLEIIAAFPSQLALADVAALSDLPKTTAHRLLKGLVKAELATGGQGGRAYSVGPRLSRILHATADDGWLEVLVRPILAALADDSGEACYLTKLVGSRVLVAVSQAPEVRWRSYVQPGIEMPPHAAATGKAIIAYQDEALIRQALAVELPKLTVNTRSDEAWIREEFARVRDRGYATCIGEIDEGLAAIAVPVRQSDGLVLYSVGMTGPLQRIMGDKLPQHLAALADASRALANKLSIGTKMYRADVSTSE